jgi:uncharacterized coiled-coil DUF342 family protein
VGEKKASVGDSPSSPGELKERIERATKLIAELREANYSLTGEIAELHRKLEGMDSSAPASSPPPAASSPGLLEELQLLRDERKIIRAKVQNLLERIERIEL